MSTFIMTTHDSSAASNTIIMSDAATNVQSSPAPAAKDVSSTKRACTRRKRKCKPADAPRRPLSAYNLFFKYQRSLIIDGNVNSSTNANLKRLKRRSHRKTHGKIGFADLARRISEKWKSLDANSKSPFEEEANLEKRKYWEELKKYKAKKSAEMGTGVLDDQTPLDENYKRKKAKLMSTTSKESSSTAMAPQPLHELPFPNSSTEGKAHVDLDSADAANGSLWDSVCTTTLIDNLEVASETRSPGTHMLPDAIVSIGKNSQEDVQLSLDAELLLKNLEEELTPQDGEPISSSIFHQQPKPIPEVNMAIGGNASDVDHSLGLRNSLSKGEWFKQMMDRMVAGQHLKHVSEYLKQMNWEELKKYKAKKMAEIGTDVFSDQTPLDANYKTKKANAMPSKECPSTATAPQPMKSSSLDAVPMPAMSNGSIETEMHVEPDEAFNGADDNSIWEDTACTKKLMEVLGVASEVNFSDGVVMPEVIYSDTSFEDNIQLDVDVKNFLKKLDEDMLLPTSKLLNTSMFSQPVVTMGTNKGIGRSNAASMFSPKHALGA